MCDPLCKIRKRVSYTTLSAFDIKQCNVKYEGKEAHRDARDVKSSRRKWLEAKILALVLALKLWPRRRPWPQTFGLGLQQKNQQSRRD